MATQVVNSFKGRLMGDTTDVSTAINFATDSFKLMLLSSSHTTDIDAHVFIDDVSTNEVAASGSYSAGGLALTLTSDTDTTNDLGTLDAADVSATSATISAQYAVLYKDAGTPGTSPIVAIYDFGSVISSSGATFSISINSSGLLTLA